MQPLRIEWTFTSPVVVNSNYLQHLDALVAFAVCDEARELGASNAVELSQELGHVFAQLRSPGGDVWKASALLYTPSTEIFTATMVRRTDPLEYIKEQDKGLLLGRARNSFNSGSGPDRNYFIHHSYQWMERATAWCIADEGELRAALTRIHALGKMTRNGFGWIKDVTIVRDDEAHDRWKFRVLPLGLDGCQGLAYIPARHCLQPPYWDRKNAVDSMEPVVA